MQHYIAERIIKAKYKRTKVVNYRQQNDNLNTLERLVLFLAATSTERIMMDISIFQDENMH